MPDLDLLKLDRYLTVTIDSFEKLEKVKKFQGGQSNPTYLVSAKSGEYVLRRQPSGKLLKSAHAVDREFRVMSALQKTDIPTPVPLHYCDDPSVIGTKFFIMSFEQGRIFWNPALPELSKSDRSIIYDAMNDLLARLHNVDLQAAGLTDFGNPGNYFERQVNRWTRQYLESQTQTIHAMDKLIKWLSANRPPDDKKISLIHGDYRLDNIIFQPDSCQVRALIDWELSTIGHPYADLAYQCMQLRLDANELIGGLGAIDRKELGIPTEEDYLELYCKRRGLTEIPQWEYYLTFSFFRLAAILQGVYKRALNGNASSEKAIRYGELVPRLAIQANAIIDQG